MSDATLTHNLDMGIYVSGTTATTAFLDYVRAFNNGTGRGIQFRRSADDRASSPMDYFAQQTGVYAHNGVLFYSYGDNSINGTTSDKSGMISPAPLQ